MIDLLIEFYTSCSLISSNLIGDQRLLLLEFHFMFISNADACNLLNNVDHVVGAYVVQHELALITEITCVVVFRG